MNSGGLSRREEDSLASCLRKIKGERCWLRLEYFTKPAFPTKSSHGSMNGIGRTQFNEITKSSHPLRRQNGWRQ
jgi:hypothetical protein